MLTLVLFSLLLSCTVNAWGGFGGWGGRGSGNPWASQPRPGFHGAAETTQVQPSSNSPTSLAVTTIIHPTSSSSHAESSSSRTTDTHTSLNSETTILSTHTSSTHSPSSSHTSSVVTNNHETTSSTSTIDAGGSSSSSISSPTDSQLPPSSSPTPSGQLDNSKSKVLTIVGICTASVLMVFAIVGCFVFRHFSKRAAVKFSSDSMVRPQMRGVSVYSPPPAFLAASPTPLIGPEAAAIPEKIPNPFASDLDYCYSTKSEISYDARSDVSEYVATVPGPSVHSGAIPQHIEPAYDHP